MPGVFALQRLSQPRPRGRRQQAAAAVVNIGLAARAGAPTEELHAQLIEFYKTHDTSKIPDVGKLLTDYAFEVVVSSLQQKYGVLPNGWDRYAAENIGSKQSAERQQHQLQQRRQHAQQQQPQQQQQQLGPPHSSSRHQVTTTAISGPVMGSSGRWHGSGAGSSGLPSLLTGSAGAKSGVLGSQAGTPERRQR
jgi:hypothetical protein